MAQPRFQKPNIPSYATSGHGRSVPEAYQTAGPNRLHRRVCERFHPSSLLVLGGRHAAFGTPEQIVGALLRRGGVHTGFATTFLPEQVATCAQCTCYDHIFCGSTQQVRPPGMRPIERQLSCRMNQVNRWWLQCR